MFVLGEGSDDRRCAYHFRPASFQLLAHSVMYYIKALKSEAINANMTCLDITLLLALSSDESTTMFASNGGFSVDSNPSPFLQHGMS